MPVASVAQVPLEVVFALDAASAQQSVALPSMAALPDFISWNDYELQLFCKPVVPTENADAKSKPGRRA